MSSDAATRAGARQTPVIDGQPARAGPARRLRWQTRRLASSAATRRELELEQRLRGLPAPTRPNMTALVSPGRGVGTTTSTFVLGSLLASHLKLRAIAVDASPESGALAGLCPGHRRSTRTLGDLLDDLERLRTAAQLNAYVSRLATGLHVLGAPEPESQDAVRAVERYGELVAFLSCFYDVVLLDAGASPLGELALARADQLVLVTTPELLSTSGVRHALARSAPERATVAITKSWLRAREAAVVEERLTAERSTVAISVPYDEQLAGMLQSATYALDALRPATRLAIKRLGVAVAGRLV